MSTTAASAELAWCTHPRHYVHILPPIATAALADEQYDVLELSSMSRSGGPRRSFVNGQPADLGVDLSEAFNDGDHVYARVEINPIKAAADAAAAEAEERGRKEGEAKAGRQAAEERAAADATAAIDRKGQAQAEAQALVEHQVQRPVYMPVAMLVAMLVAMPMPIPCCPCPRSCPFHYVP